MATKEFTYQALDAAGKTVKGTIESDSAEHAAAVLTARRLMPLNVSAAGSGLQREIHIPGLGGRTKTKDLALFSRQFASMNAAGLTLLRCLTILEEQTEKPKLKPGCAVG